MFARIRRASPLLLKCAIVLLACSLALATVSYATAMGMSFGQFGIATAGGSVIFAVGSEAVTFVPPTQATAPWPMWQSAGVIDISTPVITGLPSVYQSMISTVSGSIETVEGVLTVIWIPMWCVVLVCGAFTLLAWWFYRRVHREVVEGGCIACGYSQRGLADHKVCPECGGRPT